MENKRLESAFDWCRKNKVKRTEQLNLFTKLKKRAKKLNKKRDNISDNSSDRKLRGDRSDKEDL